MNRLFTFYLGFAVLALCGCTASPYTIEPPQSEASEAKSITIYIVVHKWHSGIVLPAKLLSGSLSLLREQLGGEVSYMEFGWGDHDFYLANQPGMRLALRALFWPTESVMHVAGFYDEPILYFSKSRVVPLQISGAEFVSLQRYISSSFNVTESGGWQPLGKGLYGLSQFYRAAGAYHLLNTCNSWTAKGIYSSGYPIDPRLYLRAEGLLDYLEEKAVEVDER